jgi:hypothetical protein
MSKYTSCELIMIFGLPEIFILNYAWFSLKFHNSSFIIVIGVCAAPLG